MPAGAKVNHGIGAQTPTSLAPDTPFTQVLSALGLPWPGLQQSPAAPTGLPPVLAQVGLMQLEIAEAYLTGARRIIDLWRTSVRDQQDQFLAGWRAQLAPQPAIREQSDPPAADIASRADSADRSQRPRAATGRSRVDHTETTVLAREH